MVIVTGPRQVGKTTLSKELLTYFEYLNYDHISDRKKIHKSDLDFNNANYILDEIHKIKNWKKWLKGYFDVRQNKNAILVTGSAKIDTYKKMGDSLAGRYYQYKLFPLDVKELSQFSKMSSESAMNKIL